jgi:hypothetical protein
MRLKFLISIIPCFLCLTVAGANPYRISVKPGRDVIQHAINKAADIKGDVVIELSGGEYRSSRTIEIVRGEWSSLTIRNKAGDEVSISGDAVVPMRDVRRVTDKKISERLQEGVRDRILEVDCGRIVDSLANIHATGFGRKSEPSWSELIVDDKPLSLSRWPNDTMALIGNIVVAGNDEDKKEGRLPIFHYNEDRPKSWKNIENMWIGGYFGHGYADDMIPVKAVNASDSTISAGMFTTYHFMTGADFRRWFAVNLLEEIDRPGEYVIDPQQKKFYFMPYGNTVRKVRLTVLEDPVIAISDCRNVTIQGVTIQNSRGIGIYMDNTENVLIQGSTIRNLGNVGICIGKGTDTERKNVNAMEEGGELASRKVGTLMGSIYENTVLNREADMNNGVRDCYIYDVGAGGVSLGGGDRKTLAPANNFVENCKIFRYNRIEKSYRPAVWIDGVGNRVSKCDIFDAPSMAILFHGNNHIIEYCDISDVCKDVDDQGSIYYGRDPSEQGNIIRYNYFHDFSAAHRVSATYHDDGACGS